MSFACFVKVVAKFVGDSGKKGNSERSKPSRQTLELRLCGHEVPAERRNPVFS